MRSVAPICLLLRLAPASPCELETTKAPLSTASVSSMNQLIFMTSESTVVSAASDHSLKSWNVMLCRSRERLCCIWTQQALMSAWSGKVLRILDQASLTNSKMLSQPSRLCSKQLGDRSSHKSCLRCDSAILTRATWIASTHT